ncbi:hypothetical protein D3C87_1712460 [compost metagenome]
MLIGHLTKYTSEIGSHGQIPSIFQVFHGKGVYKAMYQATTYTVTQDKIAGSAAVVSSAGTVLFYGTTKFGHGHHRNIVLVSTHISPESHNAIAEVVDIPGKDPCFCTLVKVCVPASRFGKGHFHSYIHFNQLGNLFQ